MPDSNSFVLAAGGEVWTIKAQAQLTHRPAVTSETIKYVCRRVDPMKWSLEVETTNWVSVAKFDSNQ